MQVEIVNFYPLDINKSLIKGTLHVYIPALEVDIRGIEVLFKRSKWYFRYPYKNSFDNLTQTEIRYPVLCFRERDKTLNMKSLIRERGIKFIENMMKQDSQTTNKP